MTVTPPNQVYVILAWAVEKVVGGDIAFSRDFKADNGIMTIWHLNWPGHEILLHISSSKPYRQSTLPWQIYLIGTVNRGDLEQFGGDI